MKMSIPATISAEAKRFYDEAEPLTSSSIELVEQQRAIEHAEALRTNPKIAEEYTSSVDVTTIGGVDVMVVTPKDCRAAATGILYFFGGAFVVGSPDVDFPIIALLAHHAGIKVYAPYYRRAPEHPCPAATDDAMSVYRALVGDNRIVVSGESAGGNLGLAMTIAALSEDLPPPAALALMSPWCDITPTGESQRQPAGFDPTLDYELNLAEPAAAYAGELSHDDPRVSPLYADFDGNFPRTLITTGTRELFLSDCARLSTRLRAAGVDARLHVWEGMWHTFEWYLDVPEAHQSLEEIGGFLRESLD